MLKWCWIHLLRADHKSPFVLWRRRLNKAPSCFQKSSESLKWVLCNLNQTYSYLIDNTKTINTKTPAHFSPTESLMYAYTLTAPRHVPLDHSDSVYVHTDPVHTLTENKDYNQSVCMCHIANCLIFDLQNSYGWEPLMACKKITGKNCIC